MSIQTVDSDKVRLEVWSCSTQGCRFAARCAMVIPACRPSEPAWRALEADHGVRCIRAEAQS